MDYTKRRDDHGKSYLEVKTTDFALLTNPILNKGSGFTEQERLDFHLHGLIPPYVSTIEEQKHRSYQAFKSKNSDLEKYIYMRDLQDSNETLFYYVVKEHLVEILPIIYTPVVGEACQNFGRIYRRPRGVFIAYPNKDKIDTILSNPRFKNIKVVVVSDGERILGLGDQGAGGMGIPIGKLALYCACAGIHPSATLPILLDTGTNNAELLEDPLYMGWKHERIREAQYDEFVDYFIQALKKKFPHIVLQWEDFALQNATRLLDKYKDQLCTFNDDIQGTAAITTGTLLSAVHVTGIALADQKIVIAGAGTAGCGIAELIIQTMVNQGATEKKARSQIYMVDRNGLLLEGMPDLLPFQEKLVQNKATIVNWNCENGNRVSLKDVIKNLHPNALLGVSAQPGLFTEELVKEMAAHVDKPIIMPLSNPISRSEALPENLMKWTKDKAVISTGSPFDTIMKHGKPFRVDQTNNVYIFPGMGLGLIASQAKRVTDSMFMAAAQALASCSPAKNNPEANLLPPLNTVRDVSFKVALAVAKEAVKSNLAEPKSDEQLEQSLHDHIWEPVYSPYKKPASKG